MTKRACFFAHYDKDGIIDDYVIYYIKELKKICDDIILASVSNVSENEQKKLDGVVKTFINRENEGYDFGSWRDGIKSIGFENLSKYDEIILANDSCYGPIFDIKQVFDEMDKKTELGAWSITISHCSSKHMQSYFLVIKKSVFEKQFFIDFINSIGERKSKIEYIMDFEVGFSKLLTKNNLKFDSYCNINPIDIFKQSSILKIKSFFLNKFSKKYKNFVKSFGGKHENKTFLKTKLCNLKSILNPLHSNPSLIMVDIMVKKYKTPLVKVMLFRDNPYYENLKKTEKIIKKCTNYDFSLIENHLKRF